ncbi:unnamed protein product [Boreogadus saida]
MRREPRSPHTAPTLAVRRPDDPNTHHIARNVPVAGAASLLPNAAQSVTPVPRSGRNRPSSAKPSGPSAATLAAGTRMGGTLPRPSAVLDQPQLPTLLRLKVRWSGFSDPVLVLPGLERTVIMPRERAATGEGCPSRVHPGTIAAAAVLGQTR